MDPLNEDELKRLLQSWRAPATPRSLSERVLGREAPWWRRIFGASFRIPVPVAVAAAVVIALFLIYRKPPEPPDVPSQPTTSLAGFQPVRRLDPILYIGGQQ
jgi:hypothetical protein